MIERSRWVPVVSVLILTMCAGQTKCFATPEKTHVPALLTLNTFSSGKILSNGIEVYSGKAIVQVMALRNDVIRVRITRDGALPEDASWAVLSSARQERARVTPESTDGSIGFRTSALRVRIDRASLRFSLTDLDGNVLQEDARGWPVEFHDNSFRIYKQMPTDEHYFGLGDKVGPLDRRNQAFTLWNTDAYSFQESTDPLYKSIPFFLTMRAGRTLGVLFDNTWCSSFVLRF